MLIVEFRDRHASKKRVENRIGSFVEASNMAGFPIFSSRRVRCTPFTSRIEAAGLTSYTVYNHMLLPTSFSSLEEDYSHLKKHVQIWDVAGQRQVEVSGPDAHELMLKLCARDISKAKTGRCYYTPITDAQGGMLNDPIVLRIDHDRYWISISDSDLALWAAGVAEGLGMNVEVREPDVSPLAIQGPKSNDVMAEVFGENIRSLKFFHYAHFDWRGHKLLIARSGFSKQGGFEVYLHDSKLGPMLWDDIWEIGRDFEMRVGCPNLIERVEGGLLSYGNDMTRDDTPLECGLSKYVSLHADHDFIGKAALKAQNEKNLRKELMGVKISGTPIEPAKNPLSCRTNGRNAGMVTSACFSPDFDTNIGIAMLGNGITSSGTQVDVLVGNEWRTARTTALPFS